MLEKFEKAQAVKTHGDIKHKRLPRVHDIMNHAKPPAGPNFVLLTFDEETCVIRRRICP